MTTEQIDQAKMEQFAGQMIGMLSGASLTQMVSIGHQTGLFDSMAGMGASTSEQIARAAGLNERYVREWLGAMTVGRIVDHDPVALTYKLPPEHAASLTRAAGPGNLAAFAQFLPLMATVEEGIVDCFQNGGGVPYSKFPTFQKLMKEESGQVFDATLINVTLPLVPGLVQRLNKGIDVADVGCGSGHAINLMAEAFPNSRFVGLDFSDEGVAEGTAEAKRMGLTNARFEKKDVSTLDGSTQYDLLTAFDTIHDQAKPRRVLKGIYDALKPGGDFLCVDIAASSSHAGNMDHPMGAMLYTISTMHCMTVSLALGGEGLGTCWGEELARDLLADAGFKKIEVAKVEGDIMNNYYIAHKS